MKKTIAMRLLEGKKVKYEVMPYPAHMRDAEEIASELGISPERLFKTLVVLPPGITGKAAKPILVMLPANKQLDLKSLAGQLNTKKLKLATHKEAEALTGLEVGGISALALVNKGFAIYLDEAARIHEEIFVSAGQRGLDVKLAVIDLVKVTGASFVKV